MKLRGLLAAALAAATIAGRAGGLRVGAAAVDITPSRLPVLVNGGFFSRTADKVRAPLHARALVLDDGRTQIGIVVVDTCLMGREFLDEVKALGEKATGIPSNRLLISATHTHTAPSALGVLGAEADESYVPYLRDRIVEAIAAAKAALTPAEVGYARRRGRLHRGAAMDSPI